MKLRAGDLTKRQAGWTPSSSSMDVDGWLPTGSENQKSWTQSAPRQRLVLLLFLGVLLLLPRSSDVRLSRRLSLLSHPGQLWASSEGFLSSILCRRLSGLYPQPIWKFNNTTDLDIGLFTQKIQLIQLIIIVSSYGSGGITGHSIRHSAFQQKVAQEIRIQLGEVTISMFG